MRTLATIALLTAVIAFAGAAYAAAPSAVEAKIPFSFTVPGAQLPAGDYRIEFGRFSNARLAVTLRDAVTGAGAMTLPIAPLYSSAKTEPARLVFRCQASNCGLAEIWYGNPDGGLEFRAPRKTGTANERVAVVYATIAGGK